METPLKFIIRLDDGYEVKIAINTKHDNEDQLTAAYNAIFRQFATTGVSEALGNGKAQHFPPHRIDVIELEVGSIVLANANVKL